MAARFLGPAGMGRQSFIAFISLSLTMLFTGAMPVALSRFIGESLGAGERGVLPGLVRWARRVEAIGAVVATASLVAVGALGGTPAAAWALAGGVAGISILQTIPSSVLSGTQRWRAASAIGLGVGGLTVGGTIAVLAAGGGITGMFAVELAASMVGLTTTSVLARRAIAEVAPQPTSSSAVERRVARYAAIGTFNVVLNFIVWRRSEFLFLKHFSSDEQIAIYSIAFAGVAALVRIPEAVGTVIAPAFSTLFGAGAVDRMRSGYSRSFRLVMLAALPLTAAALSLGPELIRLVYGSDYSGTKPVLLVLASAFPVISVVGLSRALIVGLGHQRITVVVGSAAAVVNVSLDLLLIPAHGAMGAALANAVSQVAGGLPLVAYAWWAMRPVRWDPGALARAAAAAAAGGGLAALLVDRIGGAGGLAAGGAAGGLVFVGVALTLGILSEDDARWLARVTGRRVGRVVLLARTPARHNSAA